jgi:hypothetical protein
MYSFISKSIQKNYKIAIVFSMLGMVLSFLLFGWVSILTMGISFLIMYLTLSLVGDYISLTEK